MLPYRHCADTLNNVTINRTGQNFDRFSELVYRPNCKHCLALHCILGLRRRLKAGPHCLHVDVYMYPIHSTSRRLHVDGDL